MSSCANNCANCVERLSGVSSVGLSSDILQHPEKFSRLLVLFLYKLKPCFMLLVVNYSFYVNYY